MGIDAAVGGESHERTCLECFAEVLALQAPDSFLLLDRFGQHAMLRAFSQDVVIVVDIEIEIGMVLLGKRDAFVVDQARVLDRVDAGEDCIFNRLSAVSVGCDFASELVGFVGDGFQLFRGVLRSARRVAF